MNQETYQVIYFRLPQTTSRRDDGQPCFSNFLKKRPIASRAACDFYEVETHRNNAIDRDLIKRRAHRQHAMLFNGRQQFTKVIPFQSRRQEAGDMLVCWIFALLMMHEIGQIAKLKFNNSAQVV